MVKKRLGVYGLLVCFILGIFVFGYRKHDKEESFLKDCPKYELKAVFYPEDNKIACDQRVIFTNNSNDELKELYFNIYPNAFKTIDIAPFPREEHSRAYPNGFSPGYLNISHITVNAEEVFYEIQDTLLKIVLSEPLEPQGILQISVSFDAIIPNSHGRYGYGPSTYNIANWYPILAVYDAKGWHKEPYYDVGDPFYSEVGLYNVHIKAPKEFIIAATGSLKGKYQKGDFCYWQFETELVRDFALVLSSSFEQSQAQVGKTTITSYYIDEDEEYGIKVLEYGRRAIEFFNEYFSIYPYEHFSIVATDFYIGGMEYPNLVMIGREFYAWESLLEYIVVHETAHQWWYGLVGNDEINEPWLDEALTEYSTILYYENIYGKKMGRQVYEEIILNPYRIFELEYGQRPILRSLRDFSSWREYSAIVYSRGAIMLKELERRMGKGKLQQAMIYYLKQNQYKNATTEDFMEALNHVTGTDWRQFLNMWLEGGEVLQEAV